MTDYFTAEQVYQSLKEENAALQKFCHDKQAENETLRMGYAAARLEIESLKACAGSESVAWLVCTEEGDPDMVFLSQHEAQQYLEDDERPTPLYAHPYPPDGMVGGWMPIETAPKDGTRFVAVGQNYGLDSEAQHTCIAQWLAGCWVEVSDWNGASKLKYLTHWMPLPPLLCSAASATANSVTAPAGGATGKNLLQVQAWVIPDGNGGGQFSWQKQDERFWIRLAPPAKAADSLTAPAAGAVTGPSEAPKDWRDQFTNAVYADLAAADNQDVPLEEYPARILKVLDSIVGPRHPTVIHWRNDAIQACIAIAYKYCRDPESFQYLKQDLQALIFAAPTTPPTQAADSVLEDAARLDWLLLRISGAEFRRIGVHYSGNASRADVDAARKQGENHD